MKDARKIIRIITVVAALGLVLSIAVSYAGWTYIIDNPVKAKTTSPDITFLFPRPLGPLDFTGPRTSESLWGAGYKVGDTVDGVEIGEDDPRIDKVSSTEQAQENLLVSYTALNLQINSYAETKLLISFEVTFCLAPDLIEGSSPQYPFADPYTITRDGKVIGEGNIYCENSSGVSGNVALSKGEKAFDYNYFFWLSREYYYYTAIIDPTKIDGFDPEDYVVDPPKPGEKSNYASFVLDIKHEQQNTVACFATVKIIADEYPPAEGT